MINIEKEVQFKNNDVVVIGCSSGPDSMALFSLVLELRDKYSLSIICAHVNHNVRDESIEEEEYITKFCEKNKVLLEKMTIDSYGDDNFENEARNIRYAFFEDICTVNEIKALAQRLEVAKMLQEKKTYQEIQQYTHASTATISRVNRCLSYGGDGYKLILECVGTNRAE